MAEFSELMKLLLSVPVVGAAPERAEAIARKLRMAEIEEDDIRYLDADDVKQITEVTAERVRLRRLMENMEVAEQQRWDRLPKPRQLREREEFLIERPTEVFSRNQSVQPSFRCLALTVPSTNCSACATAVLKRE